MLCTECDHRGAEVNRPGCTMTDWSRHFEDPITLPDGRTLSTLRDAGDHITSLPKAVHEAAEWQAAMEALILVAADRRCLRGSVS